MDSLVEGSSSVTSVEQIVAAGPASDRVPLGRGRPLDSQSDEYFTVIEARPGLRFVDARELCRYRDLFRFLVWRSIRVRYAQSAIGVGWAVIQPLFSMIVFTIVFGKLAQVSSDGAPYALFSFAALVPWTYFANALTDGVDSLVSNAHMLQKVYFPRLLLPMSAVVAKLLDFGIALALLFILMACFLRPPTWGVVLLPLLVLMMVVAASGLSMWLTAMAIQYRDVKHAMHFVVQLLMFAAPVVYPASLIPKTYALGGVTIYPRLLYALNPMVGVIEGFRSALLGTTEMPGDLVGIGTASALVIAVTGALYFRSKERLFADVA
jgi:lipopolysaccharide transport system permease protein